MRRLLTSILVFLLAGVPAAAVVCDLILCVTPTKAVCHEHSTTVGGARMIAKGDSCDHLAIVAPYAPTPARQTFDQVPVSTTVSSALTVVVEGRAAAHRVGVRGSPRVAGRLLAPLRI